jgi:hypothetical protein
MEKEHKITSAMVFDQDIEIVKEWTLKTIPVLYDTSLKYY